MTTRDSSTATRVAVVAGAALLLWFLWAAWARPLLLPDEGRYVGVAWEMLRSGHWLTPTLDGLPYFHKPPLFYWITATALSLLGHHEWAARLASLLGASLGAGAFYAFTRRWSGPFVARAALLVLLAQPLWLVAAQFANLDMLVAGCITATIVLLAHAVLSARNGVPDRVVLTAAWAAAALGVLAKGLIGFALPVLVIATWLVLQRRWRMLLHMLWWPGVLVFLAITAPWFAAMQQQFPDFLHYFFVVQHFERFTEGGFNNAMPFWFYPAVLSGCFLFWLPWMVRVLPSEQPASDTQRAAKLLMRVWPVMIVLFFSLPHSKLLGYILPAVPPLAAIAAEGFVSRDGASRSFPRFWYCAAGAGFAITLAILTWMALFHDKSSGPLARVLYEQRAKDEPVVVLGRYPFDLPFYARLTQPVTIVDQWDAVDLQNHDNARKEIADAGAFDRSAAATRLLLPEALYSRLCQTGVTWLVGPPAAVQNYPVLQDAQEVYREARAVLWKLDRRDSNMQSALDCH